jgi:Transposase DDE domain/Domain of unknown function (DUF4372)
VRTLPCAEHFRILAFAQLTYRESLRDIEVCLSAQAAKLYHMGIRSPVSRSTLADANERRDWRIYADFAQRLIAQARRLYADEDLGLELSNTVYVMDRGYPDFERLFALHQAGAFFVTRAKSNMNFRRVCSAPSDRAQGINCDQTILLVGVYSKRDYPVHLRRIRFKDPESGKTLVFLTNLFGPTAATICALYKARWPVELFFNWIKQHLRIKQFYGTSENAVKTQIWIAISVYVLVAIVKKKLHLDASLYTLLQIFSVTLFEKIPLKKEFLNMEYSSSDPLPHNQLNLFDS